MTKSIVKENQYKKGLWTVDEDKILTDYVKVHGKGQWNRIAKKTDLKRCGKSCRLRWMNYLSPSVNRSNFTEEEEDLIIRLHKLLGNRWSLIAKRVPGRTDNQVKNYWNTHLSKKLRVNKDQTHRVGDSSFILNSAVKVDVSESSATEETTSTACDNTTGVLLENKCTQKAVNISETHEESIIDNEGFFNSLWFSDDDLLEFLDGYSSII
ncbi:hypothetical protein ACOSP7_001773 [Xanthoceras sorbifolium]